MEKGVELEKSGGKLAGRKDRKTGAATCQGRVREILISRTKSVLDTSNERRVLFSGSRGKGVRDIILENGGSYV